MPTEASDRESGTVLASTAAESLVALPSSVSAISEPEDESDLSPSVSEPESAFSAEQSLAGEPVSATVPAEAEVEQKTDEDEYFFDRAPIGQYLLGEDGTILRANLITLELLGYDEAEFVGHAIADFYLDPQASGDCIADLFRGEQVHHREAQLRCKDDTYKSVLVSGSAVKQSGAWLYAHCFLRDITEHKLAEEKLREMNRSKDEFLATLAHELRNPLAPIRSAVEILNLQKPTPDMQWALDVIDRQMRQMSRLIDDLLDIARITRGKLELHMERVELAEVARVAFETSRPLIEAAGHTFTVDVPPEPIYLSGDLIRLAQIISNLLNNSAKYTPEGGTIWFSAKREGDQARIVVRDTGIGIEPEMTTAIFELFEQGHPSGPRRGGLGIGLTLVKRLVEMHGGTIAAASAGAGKGSTFTISLPIVTNLSQRLYRPTYDRERAPSGSSLRILVVDDNMDAAATLEKMLDMAGNTVAVAHDGVAAVEAAGAFLPEVVLLDLDLPKMNGYEVAQALRHLPRGEDLIIIAVTGFGLASDKVRSKEAGFNHHLVKPVDPASLLQLLTSIERFGGTLPEHVFQAA